jgi:thiosulfate/3-mercaptopyruvate sulfurtransferase
VEGPLSTDLAGPVVSADWLAQHAGDVVLADVRWYLDGRSGRDAYRRGHLPGAVFIDLDTVLAGTPSPEAGRHPLPSPSAFANGLSSAGLADDDVVIAYDDAGGMSAARLVWLLRATGHRAALLDGGLASWRGTLVEGDVRRPPGEFTPRPWPLSQLADADDVAARYVAGGGAESPARRIVLDARSAERYRGETEPIDPRAGHIPGAVNLPYADNLDPHSGLWRSPAELRQRFEAVGAGEGVDVVMYCGSGVTACHDLLARERAGLPAGRLYAGSWSQWSIDAARPVATGDRP